MHPLDYHFEIFVFLRRAHDTDGHAAAKEPAIFPRPGVIGTVDLSEVGRGEITESGRGIVDQPSCLCRCGRRMKQDEPCNQKSGQTVMWHASQHAWFDAWLQVNSRGDG